MSRTFKLSEYCRTIENHKILDLSQTGLKKLPSYIPNEIEYLNVGWNPITSIPKLPTNLKIFDMDLTISKKLKIYQKVSKCCFYMATMS